MWPLGPPWQAGVVRVPLAALQVGDLVAFVGERSGAVLLHRLVAIDGDRLQTRGDTRHQADPWLPASALLGRVHAFRYGRFRITVPVVGHSAQVFRRLGQSWSRLAPDLRQAWAKWRRIDSGQRKC